MKCKLRVLLVNLRLVHAAVTKELADLLEKELGSMQTVRSECNLN
jgi:hypothetical protein